MLTRRIGAWAGPVTGVAGVLCAAIAITYASGTRVDVSIPIAANVGGPAAPDTSVPGSVPLDPSAFTLVHPTHPVQVLRPSNDAADTVPAPSRSDDATTTAAPTERPATEHEDARRSPGASPSTPVRHLPTVSPTGRPSPAPSTDTWSDDDPVRSPRPSTSGWNPTGTPSPSPSASHSHDDDAGDDGSGGASQPDS